MKPRLIHVSGNGLSCRYLRHCATRSPRTARERFVFFFFTFISLRYNIPARNFTRASSVTARGCTSNTLARPRYGRSRDARKSSFLESNESLGFSCWGKFSPFSEAKSIDSAFYRSRSTVFVSVALAFLRVRATTNSEDTFQFTKSIDVASLRSIEPTKTNRRSAFIVEYRSTPPAISWKCRFNRTHGTFLCFRIHKLQCQHAAIARATAR